VFWPQITKARTLGPERFSICQIFPAKYKLVRFPGVTWPGACLFMLHTQQLQANSLTLGRLRLILHSVTITKPSLNTGELAVKAARPFLPCHLTYSRYRWTDVFHKLGDFAGFPCGVDGHITHRRPEFPVRSIFRVRHGKMLWSQPLSEPAAHSVLFLMAVFSNPGYSSVLQKKA
jgi:hypothetical protein